MPGVSKSFTASVSLIKGEDRYNNIYRALELIKPDLAKINQARRILIKPNLVSVSNVYANTDVKVVEAVIDFIYNNFSDADKKEILVMEGSGDAYSRCLNTRFVFEKFGYDELEAKYKNVTLTAVDDCQAFVPVAVKTLSGEKEISLVKQALHCDYKISLSIPKTHNFTVATLGIKNMIGLIRQEDKAWMHGGKPESFPYSKNLRYCMFRNHEARDTIPWIYKCRVLFINTFMLWILKRCPLLLERIFGGFTIYLKSVKVLHENIVTLAKVVYPDLVILDGFYAMAGCGPIDGNPIKMNLAIASVDALKADGVAARIMGLSPEDIDYLYYLKTAGFGDYSLEGLVGENLDSVKVKFKMHELYSLQKLWRRNITNREME